MSTTAEFEEKEYEQPLNFELLFDQKNNLWSPGQVLEKHFGADACLFADHPTFWGLFGYPDIPRGILLSDYRFWFLRKARSQGYSLPNFEINLLLQCKRPVSYAGKKTAYAAHGITGAYWQFELTAHQQAALERLHRTLANRALICYASPAFHTRTDLYQHIQGKELVDDSTFVQAHRLTGHHRWAYDRPGTQGVACSEPEGIREEGGFRTWISTAMEGAGNQKENADPLRNLLQLQKAIVDVCVELEYNSIAIEFRRRYERYYAPLATAQADSTRAALAYWVVTEFCQLSGVEWYCIG